MDEYKISLGVDVDTSDIQTQINTAISKSQFKKLNIEIDKKKINSQIDSVRKQMQNLGNTRISIGFDPSSLQNVHNQINNIRQQLQNLNNIRININPVVNNSGTGNNTNNNGNNNINNNIDSIRAHINNARSDIADFRRSLSSMDFDRTAIAAVTNDLERLDLTVTDITSTFRNNRLTVAVDGIDQAQRAVTVIKEYNEVGRHLNTTTRIRQSFGEDAEAARQLEERLSRLKTIASQMAKFEIDIFKLNDNPNAHVNEIAVLENQLNSLRATYSRLSSEIDFSNLTGRQVLELSAPFADAQNKLDRLEAAFADTKSKLASGIEIELREGKFAAQVAKVSSDAKKLSGNYDELRVKLDILENAERELNSAFNNGTIEQRIRAYNNYRTALEVVENQLKQNKIAEKDSLDAVALGQAKDKLSLDISSWLKENSAAAKDFGARLREIQNAVKTADSATLTRLRAEFTNIKREAQLAGKTTQTFGDKLKTQFSRYSSYLSVASLFMYATQGLRDMFRQVVSIDTAMTELKKVTDETDASYNKFLTNAASRAKELGTTIDGLVESTADFARIGYDFEDSQKLAEVANIYAVVGDEIEGVEDATQSLVSTLSAFKSEMNGMTDSEFAMSIVDKMNEVSNNYAISSGGIGQALQRSASSMAAANNSLDETVAMITAANTVAQNPEKVGNAFKTMSMRIRGAKTELEEAGESTDGMAQSTASLRQEMLALSGVDIMLDNDTFKSTYQIMDELSEKWEDLSDIAQASIIELVAGKCLPEYTEMYIKNIFNCR